MDDLDVLARDFGFGTRGKANPMRTSSTDRSSVDNSLFSDVFGGQPKYTTSSNTRSTANQLGRDFDYDSIFKPSGSSESHNISNTDKSSLPVYDQPVYDEDIFDGLPGLKSKSAAPAVRFDENVFVSASVPQSAKNRDPGGDFDDLLQNLGRTEKVREENLSSSAKINSSSKGFDDLLPGFGGGNSSARERATPESRWDSLPTVGSKKKTVLDDPFVVLENSSPPHSSSRVITDPLEEISKLTKSASLKAEVSSGNGGVFDDLDPLSTLSKSKHPLTKDNSGNAESHGSSAVPQSTSVQEPLPGSSSRYSEKYMEKKVPVGVSEESPLFDITNDSTDFQNTGQTASSLHSFESGSKVDTNPAYNPGGGQFDDIWLTVSEVPLFTQPSTAPPPSRSPPPIPRIASMSDRSKAAEFSSTSSYTQHSQSPKMASAIDRGAAFSHFDDFDDFVIGRSQGNFDENFYGSETNMYSAAAASAAAMKDAMDKAEAKFRQAKEVRERENAKAARNKESGSLEKDEEDEQEKEFREKLEREKKLREEEERERKRLESDRLKEIEREKARQAVERATREARERAAAEARLKAERAAVEKANAEARERAEKAAVQRVQAEARKRAAAEAKERAEKVATEARERAAAAAAEAREKEEREKSIRAEAEARRRSERAAVERATTEARERAAAGAREKAAAAAARMNQQNNDDDLESFFSSGRASSAPRARTSSIDPLFEQQFQNRAAPENARKTPAYGGTSSNLKKAASTTNFVDDLSSIFGAVPTSGEFQEVEGETEERRKARIERNQRTQERAAKALAEKNQRDLQAQREQEERHRIAEMLDTEIKRWAAGKEGNLRALLSTLQYVLWPECGWQPVSLTDLITGASVKKVYRKATLCIHPDKVQQKGATLQQKYIAEKVFDLLKEAWNKFNSEELF